MLALTINILLPHHFAEFFHFLYQSIHRGVAHTPSRDRPNCLTLFLGQQGNHCCATLIFYLH
ncbi:MAG: hypothetical protein WCP07_10020 [bacterium]